MRNDDDVVEQTRRGHQTRPSGRGVGRFIAQPALWLSTLSPSGRPRRARDSDQSRDETTRARRLELDCQAGTDPHSVNATRPPRTTHVHAHQEWKVVRTSFLIILEPTCLTYPLDWLASKSLSQRRQPQCSRGAVQYERWLMRSWSLLSSSSSPSQRRRTRVLSMTWAAMPLYL